MEENDLKEAFGFFKIGLDALKFINDFLPKNKKQEVEPKLKEAEENLAKARSMFPLCQYR